MGNSSMEMGMGDLTLKEVGMGKAVGMGQPNEKIDEGSKKEGNTGASSATLGLEPLVGKEDEVEAKEEEGGKEEEVNEMESIPSICSCDFKFYHSRLLHEMSESPLKKKE